MDEFLEIPPAQLSDEALQAIVEDFITREGTDYGHRDFSLAEKVAQVKRQIVEGRVFIAFDSVSESCTLIVRESL